ncbi:MAG: peptidoglycan D,D-transpeptidase FtsI family protein [Lachnospiraceae bacterium]
MTGKEQRKIRRINNRMKRKLALMFAVVVLALVGLSVRLVYINKTNGEKYTKKVLAQQESNSLTLAYRRGDIFDRNGTIVATSEKVYNVILDPKVLKASAELDKKDENSVEATLDALAQCFSYTKQELYDIYNNKINSSYVVLEKQKTKDEISGFKQMMEENDQIAGVWFEEGYQRKYPYDTLGCNVIGYTVSGNVGQYGIEETYSDILNGTNGRSYTYLNESLEAEKTIHEATDGCSVMSTIDVTLQKIVENSIDEFMEKYRDQAREGGGAKTAACIMMDPRNGEILAMASNRKYDLNKPYDVVANGLFTEEEVAQMNLQAQESEEKAGEIEEQKLNALNALWRNFCVSDTYEPGSTVKPMTVAAALECGAISPNEMFFCDGGQQVVAGKQRIKCAKRSGHGLITLEGSIMFSCNDALMQIAAKMGYDDFVKYQRMFNFGLRTGIDLPGESRTDTVVYYPEGQAPYANLEIGPMELATCSFGQGFNVSMVQVASAFSSCINGGYYYQPHVVKKIMDSNGGTVKEIEGKLLRTPISEKTSEKVKQYLYNTMYGPRDANGNGATGKNARIAGYAMGGKTGTAQKIPRGQGNYLVSFIGYAPYDTPQVVCYVVVDEPNSDFQASSSYAQEIWKNIMKQALPYLNIFETEEPPADMMAEYLEAHPEKDPANIKEESGETKKDTEETTQSGPMIDPQTGEEVSLPDVSGDNSIDPETGMLKDLTQDDDYPSEILENVQPSVEELP